MPGVNFGLRLRECTLDDAALVSDLETTFDPDDASDPARRLHWWRMADQLETSMRRVADGDGTAMAYTSASHEPWEPEVKRYGVIRTMLRHDQWSEEVFGELIEVAEEWLRGEGATTAVVRMRSDLELELNAVTGVGYREDRRMRISELDLVANKDRILATLDEIRRRMREQAIDLHVLKADTDPARQRQLYEMVIESERDIPTTVPWRTMSFDEWTAFWFSNPGIREDWFWVARNGEGIVGTSVLDLPVVRGLPWTAYTGTSRAVRGRGIGRALKYESMAQAIGAGFTRVRTSNDADNPPILRINEEMGYRPVAALIELHRPLSG